MPQGAMSWKSGRLASEDTDGTEPLESNGGMMELPGRNIASRTTWMCYPPRLG